jgi:hypothetical protein
MKDDKKVIRWLRSPAGEKWSRQRIQHARELGDELMGDDDIYPFLNRSPAEYGDDPDYDRVLGFFSMKELEDCCLWRTSTSRMPTCSDAPARGPATSGASGWRTVSRSARAILELMTL